MLSCASFLASPEAFSIDTVAKICHQYKAVFPLQFWKLFKNKWSILSLAGMYCLRVVYKLFSL